jgi:predicted PurR-regulated permease PerM
MTKPKRNSYLFIAVAVILIGCFRLGTPLVAALFSYFVLSKLDFLGRKWLTICVFIALVSFLGLGLAYFLDQAIRTLPQVATTAIPVVIQKGKDLGIELPFTDWDSLKIFAMDTIKGELRYLSGFARTTAKQFVLLVIGIVIAVSIYLNPATDLNREGYVIKNNLYTVFANEVAARFRALYQSFATVMGAQLIISVINTGLTSVFLLCVKLPSTPLMLVITLTCGLLPIVGNLISNSIIVGIALTVSPKLALMALIFLIILHKLEYFLNSTIVGDRIKNPVWLTLIGLVVGERLMGITGMILAPVILHYMKIEASQLPVAEQK